MQSTDLKVYKSLSITDTGINGGREGYAEVQSGVLNNAFPSVGNDEREAGGTRLRKLFFRNENASGEALANARAFIKALSTAEDHFVLIEGEQRDTQADLTGSEKQYASGALNTLASAGATEIVADFDEADDVDLADGDMVRISGTNGSMFNTVSGTPSWDGNEAGITLAEQLNVDYPAGSIAAMVLECGTLEPSIEDWTETSGSGTYNETSYPPELNNKGSVDDDWTILFTSATDFTCSGLYEGSVGSGEIGTDFEPTNPNTSTPYFTLRTAGFGGSWTSGDTITFTTHPSSKGVWAKEIWAAGAAA